MNVASCNWLYWLICVGAPVRIYYGDIFPYGCLAHKRFHCITNGNCESWTTSFDLGLKVSAVLFRFWHFLNPSESRLCYITVLVYMEVPIETEMGGGGGFNHNSMREFKCRKQNKGKGIITYWCEDYNQEGLDHVSVWRADVGSHIGEVFSNKTLILLEQWGAALLQIALGPPGNGREQNKYFLRGSLKKCDNCILV